MTDAIIDPRALHAARAKYAPHLNFRTKAAIYALFHRRGVGRKVLADAFGVHRLTVAHIVDDNPKHYADVKSKVRELGLDELDRIYVKGEDIAAINAAIIGDLPGPREIKEPRSTVDRNASSHAGEHRKTIRGERGRIARNLYIDVVWRGEDSLRAVGKTPGWYWRYLSGGLDLYGPFDTSMQAYSAAGLE